MLHRDFVPWRFSNAGRISARLAHQRRRPKTCTIGDVGRVLLIWIGSQNVVRRQRPRDPLQLELADWLDLHGKLDLRQHSWAD